jgi:hypothetical protein
LKKVKWWVNPPGHPLRCDLDGAQWSRDGVLLAGDAAGATYAFSGEGIGKSLETGIACAEVLLEHVQWHGQTSDVEDKAVQQESLGTIDSTFAPVPDVSQGCKLQPASMAAQPGDLASAKQSPHYPGLGRHTGRATPA